jgi:hypothetical protein
MAGEKNARVEDIIAAIKTGAIDAGPPPAAKRSGVKARPDLTELIASEFNREAVDKYEAARATQRQKNRDHADDAHRAAVAVSGQRWAELKAKSKVMVGDIVRVDTPFFVWSTGPDPRTEYQLDVQVEPRNTIAKFHRHYDADPPAPDDVSFYFLWNNEGAAMQTHVFSSILVNGMLTAGADEGPFIFPGGSSSISMMAILRPLLNLNPVPVPSPGQPNPTPFEPQQQHELSAHAAAESGWNAAGDVDTVTALESAGASYHGFTVPAHTAVLFQMILQINYRIDDGSVDVDFQSGQFGVMCPGVVIQRIA